MSDDRRGPLADGQGRFRSVFCSFLWPQFPGFSGGDIRDFQLLCELLAISEVEFFALDPGITAHGQRSLVDEVSALHTADSIRRSRSELVDERWLRNPWPDGVGRERLFARRRHVFHADVAEKSREVGAYLRSAVQHRLDTDPPDFLFVSPQSNPLGLMLDTEGIHTRSIMATYDVEAVRLERLAASRTGWARLKGRLEARRAARYERDSLDCYDGVIAVTELDRDEFVRRYQIDSERVAAIDYGVDLDYYGFVERAAARPSDAADARRVVFVSSLAYEPNRQAAWRLIERIMPLVRTRYPGAELVIVGQQPGERLRRAAEVAGTEVTGTVDDVRPHLRKADVACVPLLSGSGIKYKILEAMSAGVPLVCTKLSLVGMDLVPGEHVLVGDSDAEIAAAIVALLDDPDLAATMARRARREVELRYGDRSRSRLGDWLVQLLERPRRLRGASLHRGNRGRTIAGGPPPRTASEDSPQGAPEVSTALGRAFRYARAGEFGPRSRFGPLGILGKRFVNRLTRFQISRQTEFNRGTVQALHEAELRLAAQQERLDDLDRRITAAQGGLAEACSTLERMAKRFDGVASRVVRVAGAVEVNERAIETLDDVTTHHRDRLATLAAEASSSQRRLAELAVTTTAQGRHLDEIGTSLASARELIARFERRLGEEIERVESTLERIDRRVRPGSGIDQLAFADHFRGDEALIRERANKYVGLFEGTDGVVDLGCGRGEFLEACRDAGVAAYGVDIDVDMVGRCSVKGLAAHLDDALEHLRSLDDESVGGLFSAQVVEHLGPGELVELIELAARKMKPGAPIVLESINPASFYALRWFHADPDHRAPVAPETLKYLLQAAGFTLQDVLLSSPPPSDERLERLPAVAGAADFQSVYNDNVDKLNELLFGMQDYAVIAIR